MYVPETRLLSVRIPLEIADRIEALAAGGRRKTAVATEILTRGFTQLDEEEMAAGFALLGEPEMQDMQFPTGAQLEAMRLAD